ncbi:hypothetical protein SDC9_140191 [bioreactor metagenome]|uniref:Uncharacterized protein n=1 Tax=bioreactor metagenome TaxID=1076179 RepID=A0A645DUU2_9ZZZZ
MGSGSAVCYNNKNNIKILGKMAKTWCGMVAGGPAGRRDEGDFEGSLAGRHFVCRLFFGAGRGRTAAVCVPGQCAGHGVCVFAAADGHFKKAADQRFGRLVFAKYGVLVCAVQCRHYPVF